MDWPETCIHSLFYNALVKTWDVIIIGAGIIGLSLATSLRKQGLRVLIVERGEPGREASHAAAGMLAGSGLEIPPLLRPLAEESARLYPEFVHELEDESGITGSGRGRPGGPPQHDQRESAAAYVSERSVDPRTLVAAAIKAAKHRGA